MTEQRGLFPTFAAAPGRAARWIGRLLRRLARPVLWVVLALLVVHLVATVITGTMLNHELARLKARGESLRIVDLVEKLPPGAPNAAPIYQKAFDSLRMSEEEKTQAVDDPETFSSHVPAARQLVANNGEYFRLLEQASRIPGVSFPVDWSDPFKAAFPHYAKMREAARFLTIRAKLRLMDGQVDAAAEDCATMLRIARHTSGDPTLISCLVSYAMHKIALLELQEVLSAGAPSQVICRDLLQQVTEIDDRKLLSRALQGERGWGTAFFADARRRPSELAGAIDSTHPDRYRLALRLYPTVGRPLMNLDQLAYYRAMDAEIAAARGPYPGSAQRVDALGASVERLPLYRAYLTKMLMPVFSRAMTSSAVDTAIVNAAEIALRLKLYKEENGNYPASLDALGGGPLPLDPFTQKPYHYRKEGNGFLVWSVGPDLEDNGGAVPPSGYSQWMWQQPGPDATKLHADLVYRVTR